MPVVKGQQATLALKEAIVLDLGDVSAQAARIITAAQEKARGVIEQAQVQAQRIVESASADGFEEGREKGEKQGHQTGLENGQAQAIETAQARFDALHQSLTQAADLWEQHLSGVTSEAPQAVLEMALRLTEKIIHRVVEIDDHVIVEQVAHALAHVLGPMNAKLHIHPDDRAVVEQAMPSLLTQLTHLKHVEVADDDSLTPGGCVLNYGSGQIDASLDTQLARVVELMFPDEPDKLKAVTGPSTQPAAKPDFGGDSDGDTPAPKDSDESKK